MKANLDSMVITSRNGDAAEHVAEDNGKGETGLTGFEGIERVFKMLQPGRVFGEPVVSGEYTVITASELSTGGGFGMGKSNFSPGTATARADEEQASPPAKRTPVPFFSSGGGGGGGSTARPIALIVIGPEGVKIQPILDVGKIVLTWIGVWSRVAPELIKLGIRNKALKAR